MDILLIYQYCTFGGVERVILSRAEAFQKHRLDVKISVGYLHDSGALSAFKRYVHDHKLDEMVKPSLIEPHGNIKWSVFDLILAIDTPQILGEIKDLGNVYLECHTPYKENRQYLRSIPDSIKAILVPSESFKLLLQGEFPLLPKIYVIPNHVTQEFFEISSLSDNETVFPRKPLSYLGRLDKLKNIDEVLQIFELFRDVEEIMYILVGNGASDKRFIMELKKRELLAKTLLRDKIDFNDVPSFVRLTKKHNGIYLSASQGESFGLSPAEFMSGGVPVILSDIPAHRELVNNDERFLYKPGNINSAKEKVFIIFRCWSDMSAIMRTYSTKFTDEVFWEAWLLFLKEQGIKAQFL